MFNVARTDTEICVRARVLYSQLSMEGCCGQGLGAFQQRRVGCGNVSRRACFTFGGCVVARFEGARGSHCNFVCWRSGPGRGCYLVSWGCRGVAGEVWAQTSSIKSEVIWQSFCIIVQSFCNHSVIILQVFLFYVFLCEHSCIVWFEGLFA